MRRNARSRRHAYGRSSSSADGPESAALRLHARSLPRVLPGCPERAQPRFVRVLEVFSDSVKFTPDEKEKMLTHLKFGLAADPKAAGYTDGVLPYDVPDYDESEMEPWLNFGVKGAKRPEPKVPINAAYRQAE